MNIDMDIFFVMNIDTDMFFFDEYRHGHIVLSNNGKEKIDTKRSGYDKASRDLNCIICLHMYIYKNRKVIY